MVGDLELDVVLGLCVALADLYREVEGNDHIPVIV